MRYPTHICEVLAKLVCLSGSQKVVDPFLVKSLPSEVQLHAWEKDIKNNGRMKYIETFSGTLDISCIKILLKLHIAKNIQAAVQQGINWFSKSYTKPQTVSNHPPPSLIEDFQKMLYFNRYDEIIEQNDMTAMELAMVCVNRWVSSDHITWVMKVLTESQKDTYCSFLNASLNMDPTSFRRFKNANSNEDLPSKFLFALNVCRSENGTFLGSDECRGCHWALCHVDIEGKKIIYGDSLAWPFPDGLLCRVERVEKYIKAVNKDEDISNYSIDMMHDPQSRCPMSGNHRCGASCACFYPLQTCSNICGIVVMVVAAIACYNFEFFKHISTKHNNAAIFPPVFLKTPTRFGKYLRLVVASWFACNAVILEYVVPQFWKHQDHTISFCPIANTAPTRDCRSTEGGKHDIYNDKSQYSHGIPTPTADHNDEYGQYNPTSTKKDMICDSDDDIVFSPARRRKHSAVVTSETETHLPAKEKQYKCSYCDSKFTRKYTLKRHIQTKHTTKQTDGNCCCHYCDFKCEKITELQKHLAKMMST